MDMATKDTELIATIKDLTAGTIGGCAGIIAGQPLDTIRIRLQTQAAPLTVGVPLVSHPSPLTSSSSSSSVPVHYRSTWDCALKIMKHEGPRAFFKGMQSPLLGNAPLNAVVFGCNGNANRVLDQWFPRDLSSLSPTEAARPSFWRLYAAASWAGAIQTIVCTPVELIKCKLQVQVDTPSAGTTPHYRGPWDVVKQVYARNGITGLYRGWVANLWRDAPAYGAWFITYEYVKFKLTPVEQLHMPATWVLLVSGGLAGVATWIMTYPFDVIKSVIQTAPDNTPPAHLRIAHICRVHYAREGWRWFIRGLGPTLVRAVPTNAVTFLVYDRCQSYIKYW